VWTWLRLGILLAGSRTARGDIGSAHANEIGPAIARRDRIYNTLRSIIVDVLRNARVRGEFSHESIAQQIEDTCALCGVWISTRRDREREAIERSLAPAAVSRGTFERLQYTIDLIEN